MDEIHEFTMENETINLLLYEITEMLKHSDITEQQGIDLINMAEALKQAYGMRITFNL